MSARPYISTPNQDSFWLTRFTRPILFFAIVLTLAGAYFATQVPISGDHHAPDRGRSQLRAGAADRALDDEQGLR